MLSLPTINNQKSETSIKISSVQKKKPESYSNPATYPMEVRE